MLKLGAERRGYHSAVVVLSEGFAIVTFFLVVDKRSAADVDVFLSLEPVAPV